MFQLEPDPESSQYLSQQLLTYIGNKRKLLDFIEQAVISCKNELGRDRVLTLDAFAGSGVVSRLLKRHSSKLISNDLERYAEVVGQCYLANRSEIDVEEITGLIRDLNDGRKISLTGEPGIIETLYAPKDIHDIKPDERAFYTTDNARIIDNMRGLISLCEPAIQSFVLAPLLHAASVHANTSGVFKGFHKDRNTGLGKFGGTGADALDRITKEIILKPPVFSAFECEWEMRREDANKVVSEVEVDIAYFDPPYNQHPYGSNYFMLNVIADNEWPTEMSKVSGIPVDWNKSAYNKRGEVSDALERLVRDAQAKYLLISYNSEGFVSPDEFTAIIQRHGALVEIRKQDHPTFRGSRNGFENRAKSVDELLFVIRK
jgi:adenine-specific DNA-methyltransferase